MSRLTKKQKSFAGKVDTTKLYPFADALKIVKECATAKFDESIDVAVQLGIDAKKSDQVVRGAVVMPNDAAAAVTAPDRDTPPAVPRTDTGPRPTAAGSQVSHPDHRISPCCNA